MVMVVAMITDTDCVAEAASVVLLPAWVAVMVADPGPTARMVVPDTVATAVLLDEYTTAKPKSEVAARVADWPLVNGGMEGNVMIWGRWVMTRLPGTTVMV